MCPSKSKPIPTSFCQRDYVTRWVLTSASLAACATVELCSAKRLLYAIGGWSWAITRTLRHRIAIRKYQTDMWRGRQCFWVKLLLRIKANDTIGSNISLSRNFHGLVVDQYTRHGSASSRARYPHHLQQSRAYRGLLSDIIWRVLCSYIIPNKLHN